MKRRDWIRQAIDTHLPDRKAMLLTLLSEAPPPRRSAAPRRAAAGLLAAVVLTACAGAAWYFAGRSKPEPQVADTAQLRLFASGITASQEYAAELEPNIEVQLSMWGSLSEFSESSDPAGLVKDFESRQELQSTLEIQGEGLRAYTISCDNGRLVYYPESYPELRGLLLQKERPPEASRHMSCIYLPAEVPYQEALRHAQAKNAAYFENLLKDSRYQQLRERYFSGEEITLAGSSFSVLQTAHSGAALCVLRADWENDPLPQIAARSITVLRPQENAMLSWEPDAKDYRKLYEPGPFSYADFGSATITVSAEFEGGRVIEKHLFVYFSEDGYQTIRLLD